MLSGRRPSVGYELALDGAERAGILLVDTELRGRLRQMGAPNADDAAECLAPIRSNAEVPTAPLSAVGRRDEPASRQLVDRFRDT